MTALELLSIITAALLLQAAASVSVLIWRRRTEPLPADLPEQENRPEPRIGAWSGWRDFHVTARTFEDAAKTQCSFYLQPVDGLPLPDFRPGQYLTFSLPQADAGSATGGSGPQLIRCYSLSDRPDSRQYRITVKRMSPPPGRPDLPPGAASGHFHDRVQVGDILKVRAPAGQFVIDDDPDVPAVFIAGGIGITPMMSMLCWCLTAQPGRMLYLYYGVHDGAGHAFRQVLDDLANAHPNFKLHVVYGCPAPEDVQGRNYHTVGHIDLALLSSTLALGRHQFYVCGPPPMMQTLVPALRAWCLNPDDIHFEAFGPATVPAANAATNEPLAAATLAHKIRLRRSGRSLVWDGQDANLLDFAERQGVVVESGCRTGSCGTCETRLISGTVQYDAKPDYDIPSGHCLLCVAKPGSALELEL